MKGGAGRFVYGFSSTERTEKSAPSSRSASPSASSSVNCRASLFSVPSEPKSRPWATRAPSTDTSLAVK